MPKINFLLVDAGKVLGITSELREDELNIPFSRMSIMFRAEYRIITII